MKKTLSIFLITLVAMLFAACPARTETNTNTNTAEPEMTLEATLVALDKAASEAYAAKNGKHFETFLTDDFVGQSENGRFDRAMVVKGITEMPCDIKSASSSDIKIVEIADGVALQTGKGSSEGTCDGKDTPDNYFATLFVKEGDTWKGAYHQANDIPPAADAAKPADGDDAAKTEDAGEAKKEEEKPAADAEAKKEDEAPMTPKVTNDEEVAKALTEIENGLWEAWKKKDTKPFEDALADNFGEIGDMGYHDRAAAIKEIGEHKCEITSSSLTDGMATKVTDDVYIFTYQGKMAGSCDGNAMPDAPMHITTIFVKDGDAWKPAFHMGSMSKA